MNVKQTMLTSSIILATLLLPASYAKPTSIEYADKETLAVQATVSNGETSAKAFFIIDTGASHTVISTRLAKKLNIAITDKISLTSADGVHVWPMGKLKSLTIGNTSFDNIEVVVQDVGGKEDYLFGGLIGLETLRKAKFAVTNDILYLNDGQP